MLDSAPIDEIRSEMDAVRPLRRPITLKVASAETISMKEFPPIKYVVPEYIPEGLTILAGPPKIGKSWLLLELSVSIAAGGVVLKQRVEQGNVLYCALEDNERRIKSRLEKQFPFDAHPPELDFCFDVPRLDQGGVNAIREWIESVPKPRLVIVDTFQKVRGERSQRETTYESDYTALKELHNLTSETGVGIILAHHTRKMGADDPMDRVSGTQGLTGAADTTLVLERKNGGVTLFARGRDVEENEVALAFLKGTCRWEVLGKADEVHRTDERETILTLLRENEDEAMTPAEIADALGLPRNNVRQLIFKMKKSGEIIKDGSGRYLHPEYADNTDNGDNTNV